MTITRIDTTLRPQRLKVQNSHLVGHEGFEASFTTSDGLSLLLDGRLPQELRPILSRLMDAKIKISLVFELEDVGVPELTEALDAAKMGNRKRALECAGQAVKQLA